MEKSIKQRIIDYGLPYNEIVIRTKLKNGEVIEGKSISLGEVTLDQLMDILSEQEILGFIKQGVNVAINNADRNALKPAVSHISKIMALVNEGKVSKEDILKLLS